MKTFYKFLLEAPESPPTEANPKAQSKPDSSPNPPGLDSIGPGVGSGPLSAPTGGSMPPISPLSPMSPMSPSIGEPNLGASPNVSNQQVNIKNIKPLDVWDVLEKHLKKKTK